MNQVSKKRPKIECDIESAMRKIWQPGQVMELRALEVPTDRAGNWKKTFSGYFDHNHILEFSNEAAKLTNCGAKGVYFTLNPVDSALIARCANQVKQSAKGTTTADHDIKRIVWLPVDTDPTRPSGISSTEEQKTKALQSCQSIKDFLSSMNWPEPIVADSGNGGHLLYRVDLPVEQSALIQKCLQVLAQKFSNEDVDVDEKVFNPARIWKVYGTFAKKGSSTEKYPHRQAKVLSCPDELQVAGQTQLEELAALFEEPIQPTKKQKQQPNRVQIPTQTSDASSFGGFSIDEFVSRHFPSETALEWKGTGRKWELSECPFNPNHKKKAFVCEHPNGAIVAGCQKSSCSWDWHDLREKLAPKEQHKTTKKSSYKRKKRGKDNRLECLVPFGLEPASQAILQAAKKTNKVPLIFVRGRELIRLVFDNEKTKQAQLVTFDGKSLLTHLTERILFQREKEEKEETIIADKDINAELCSLILERTTLDFPPIKDIIRLPVLSPTGLILKSGYHESLEAYVDIGRLKIQVPETPTEQELSDAKSLIFDNLFHDFPFLDDSSKANALALGLLPFLRPIIDGPTPPHLLTATSPRTGKSLLVTLLSTIATGGDFEMITPCEREEEWKKTINSVLMRSPSIICIDNVNKTLDSASLASVWTRTNFSERILGTNKQSNLRNHAVWTITANNPQVSEELTKRCVWIGLDAKMENPEERKDFLHKRIVEWAKKNRKNLVTAFLTIIQSWHVAGQPIGSNPPRMGGFEAWVDVMSGILEHLNVEGFLQNKKELVQRASSESNEWKMFVSAWWEEHADGKMKVSDLRALADEIEVLGSVLGDKSERSQSTRLGKALQKNHTRIWQITENSSVILERTFDRNSKSNKWCLLEVGKGEI
jgi:hypothetical protein